MGRTKQRNKCLDYFKGIACIAVVLLHIRLPFDNIDGVIQSMSRFAVPLFFMVSGYYCYYNENDIICKKLPSKIRRIFNIGVVSLVYWIFVQVGVSVFGMGEHSLIDAFRKMITLKSLISFILFNSDPVINILWFVFALLYSYIVIYIFARLDKIKLLIYVTPFLLALHFLLGNISYKFGVIFKPEIYRNCWLMGLPLFMLGYVIRSKNIIMRSRTARNLIFFGLVLSVIEWLIVGGRQQMYIGSIITAASMIIYSEQNQEKEIFKPLYSIGNKYSLFIYVTHISVGIVLDRIAKMTGYVDNIVYLTLKPSIVIIGTIVFAVIFYQVVQLASKRSTIQKAV